MACSASARTSLWAAPGRPSFYGYDGHENVRFLSNTAGTVTDSYQYDAFGMPIASSGTTSNSFQYSAERFDSSVGLYDLRARYYDQATGRFWARDPEEGMSCTPLTFNSYIYAIDDPIDRADPTGRATTAVATLAQGSEYLGLLVLVSFAAIHPLQQLGRVISEDLDCAGHFAKCILTRLNSLPGSVYGSGRCLWCFEGCVRNNGVWPSRVPSTRGSVRCDYWNY
jgi:RHS repeat-associated protein